MALTAFPTVTRRISGFCCVAWSMTSPMPSSSNMPATRPRWSNTWLRYEGSSSITISSGGEEILPDLQENTKNDSNGRGRCGMSDEEIGLAKEQYEERLAVIEAQLEEVRRRLHKLYDALETGKLEVEDLAPRLKELKAQADDLEENVVT